MLNEFSSPETRVKDALGEGVEVRWVGRPCQGLMLRRSDWLLIPFSLMWGGFAIFWESAVISTGAPFFFKLWGVPFVLVGLYVVGGRFLADAYIRAHTIYAVGAHAIYFIRDSIGGGISTLRADALSPIELQLGPNGSGTIVFADSSPRFMSYQARWRATTAPAYAFEGIPDVKNVYDLVTSIT